MVDHVGGVEEDPDEPHQEHPPWSTWFEVGCDLKPTCEGDRASVEVHYVDPDLGDEHECHTGQPHDVSEHEARVLRVCLGIGASELP